MQFRDHPGVQGKRDAYPFDPRLLKIEPSYNVRDLDAPDEREDLKELKESIRANGVRVPLEVRLVDDDVFIIAGHRRHKAVMELIGEGEPIKAVPVIPEPKNTSPEDRIINLVVSNSGKPLKPLEVAEVVRRLVAFGWEKQQIAARLGKSASAISGYLDMIAMPEPVKEQVRENVISATEAAKVVKNLPKGTDPTFAAKLIDDNKAENKRLGVGAKREHKVTAATLRRDRPKPEAAPTMPKEPAPQPAPIMAANTEVEPIAEKPEIHEQLQTAVARENGHPPVVRTFPPEAMQPPSVNAQINSAMFRIVSELATYAEQNDLNERANEGAIEVPVSLLKRAWELYNKLIGDTSAAETKADAA